MNNFARVESKIMKAKVEEVVPLARPKRKGCTTYDVYRQSNTYFKHWAETFVNGNHCFRITHSIILTVTQGIFKIVGSRT